MSVPKKRAVSGKLNPDDVSTVDEYFCEVQKRYPIKVKTPRKRKKAKKPLSKRKKLAKKLYALPWYYQVPLGVVLMPIMVAGIVLAFPFFLLGLAGINAWEGFVSLITGVERYPNRQGTGSIM